MTQYDPNADRTPPPVRPAGYVETVETVAVRESNTGWWIAGVLGGVVLIAVLWILFARGEAPATNEALLDAQVAAAEARARADQAVIQGQVAGAQVGADIARSDAARAQAEAARAEAEARAAEARAQTPVVIEREIPAPAPADGVAVVTPTSPQP